MSERNEPSQHPEVQSNPEDLLPVSAVTRDRILAMLDEKLQGSSEEKDYFIQGNPEYSSLALSSGQSDRLPADVVALIELALPGQNNDIVAWQEYRVIKTPDGIQFEKRLNSADRVHIQNFPDPDAIEMRDAEFERNEKAFQEERELGLTFVSEHDAKELANLLESVDAEDEMDLS